MKAHIKSKMYCLLKTKQIKIRYINFLMKEAQTANLQISIKKIKHCILALGKIKELIHHSQDKINYRRKSSSLNRKRRIMILCKDFFKNQKFKFIKRIFISSYLSQMDKINFQQQKK